MYGCKYVSIVSVYVCMSVYYVCVLLCVCRYACMLESMYVCKYLYAYVCISVRMYACLFIGKYVSMYACEYMYVYYVCMFSIYVYVSPVRRPDARVSLCDCVRSWSTSTNALPGQRYITS